MGCVSSVSAEEKSAKKRNAQIEKELVKAKEAMKDEIKILLLGMFCGISLFRTTIEETKFSPQFQGLVSRERAPSLNK
jgi:hypothetical protein